MRIGIAATRLAGVDGVTFETVKWEVCARGARARDAPRAPATSTRCARTRGSSRRCTSPIPRRSRWRPRPSTPPRTRVELRRKIRRLADALLPPLRDWVERRTASRRWSSRTPGRFRCTCRSASRCRDLAAETGLPAIGHHHDYWWERERFADLRRARAAEGAFPPDLPNVRHVSINSLAAAQLLERRGLASRSCQTCSTSTSRDRAQPRDDVRARSERARDGQRRPARRAADPRGAAQGHRARDRARRSPRRPGCRAAHHEPGGRRGYWTTSSRCERQADRARRAAPIRSRPLRAASTRASAASRGPLTVTMRTWPPTSSPTRASTRASATRSSRRSSTASRWS